MLTEKDMAFLQNVELYVKENPKVASYVAEYSSKGLERAITELTQAKADMEIIAMLCLAKRYDGREELIKSKLLASAKHHSMNWEWYLKAKDKKATNVNNEEE